MHLTSIQSRIIFSHIKIILISFVFIALVFNLSIGIYLRNQTKSQLVTATRLVEKTLDKDFLLLEAEQKGKVIVKIDKTLKQAQLFFNINYGFITKDFNLVYPPQENLTEFTLLQENILPLLIKQKLNLNSRQQNIRNFNVGGKSYAVTFYPLKVNQAYLVIYSDLSSQKQAVLTINLILLVIMILTSLLAIALSKRLSKNISEPIYHLGIYAQNIGDRQYDVQIPQFKDEELYNLAITMQTMAKKISTYDNTIKSFVQNASHELRTPLMSIQGYAEGIKYKVIENQAHAIEIIIEESHRLSRLVEDLLYLTKIDTFKDDLTLENTNIEHLIRGCIDRMSGILVNNKIHVNLNCSNNLVLPLDEEKISRAIINILANGTRYAKTKVDISVKTEKEHLILEISDDGEGIDPKDLPHIFERFYKGVGGNYGLGLTIAKTVIEKHQGTLNATNGADSGAVFGITLPIPTQL